MKLDTNARILLCEDSAIQRRLIEGALGAIGFRNVEAAIDGYTALELLKTRRYDIIISDWDMPRATGYDLLLVVRSTPRHANIAFLMVTAKNDKPSEDKARRAGVSAYLEKPFKVEELENALWAACEHQRRRAMA